MKEIKAVIRQEKLDNVKNALVAAGFPELTAYEVRGRGRQNGYVRYYRGREYRLDLIPKAKVEIVVDDGDVNRVVDLLVKSAFTGDVGDGKIFISSVEEAIRIRTGEKGKVAI